MFLEFNARNYDDAWIYHLFHRVSGNNNEYLISIINYEFKAIYYFHSEDIDYCVFYDNHFMIFQRDGDCYSFLNENVDLVKMSKE